MPAEEEGQSPELQSRSDRKDHPGNQRPQGTSHHAACCVCAARLLPECPLVALDDCSTQRVAHRPVPVVMGQCPCLAGSGSGQEQWSRTSLQTTEREGLTPQDMGVVWRCLCYGNFRSLPSKRPAWTSLVLIRMDTLSVFQTPVPVQPLGGLGCRRWLFTAAVDSAAPPSGARQCAELLSIVLNVRCSSATENIRSRFCILCMNS